jgi:DNA-binding transcriptional regulator GbsR (MarR family)
MADSSSAAEQLALRLIQSGMQRMPSRVLSVLLFAEQETITAGEIAERLRVSAGTVSGAIRMLTALNMIERAPVPGSRREHYRFPADGWARLTLKQDTTIRMMIEAAEQGVDTVGEDSIAGARLAEMRDFYSFVLEEMPGLVDRWYEHRKKQGK